MPACILQNQRCIPRLRARHGRRQGDGGEGSSKACAEDDRVATTAIFALEGTAGMQRVCSGGRMRFVTTAEMWVPARQTFIFRFVVLRRGLPGRS